MSSAASATAIALLLFSTFTQGHFGILDRSYSVNVTEGQGANLSCQIENEHKHKLTQIEWKKTEGRQEDKIAVYNPSFEPTNYFWKNVSMILDKSAGELRGSFLQLQALDVWHSGIYVCELATFPAGTVKVEVHLSVTAVRVSAGVLWPNRAVREGDNVTVFCNSTPPAESYSLWPQKNKSSILKNKDGRFTLANVSREDGDLYVCQPGNSSGLSFHGHRASVNFTVNYLDEIKCDANHSLEVTAGQNFTVTCTAKASQNSQYTWRKDNVTVSSSGSLHLVSVSSEQAGVYALTAVVKDTGLRRQVVFNITVWSDFRNLPTSIAPPISTTATNENSHDVTLRSTAVSTATKGSTASGVSSPPTRTANSRAPERNVSTGPASPSPFNATLPPFEYNGTEVANASSHRQPTTTPSQPTSTPSQGASVTATVHLSNSSHNVTDVGEIKPVPTASKGYIALIVLSVIFLLVVILLLYRRHMIQRKMDMPPPFRPPPPPVKYTSVRTQDTLGHRVVGTNATWDGTQ